MKSAGYIIVEEGVRRPVNVAVIGTNELQVCKGSCMQWRVRLLLSDEFGDFVVLRLRLD